MLHLICCASATWVRLANAPRVCGARSTATPSCPGRVQRGEAERNECRDPAQDSRSAASFLRSVVSLLVSWSLSSGRASRGPGGSPGTREIGGARTNRWPYPYSRCQTAQSSSFPRRVAPGFCLSFSRPPDVRGGRSADRRTMSVVACARRDMIRASEARRVP
jgi:hypothetical protein